MVVRLLIIATTSLMLEDPWVVSQLGSCDSFFRINFDHSRNEVATLWCDVRDISVLTDFYPFKYFFLVHSLEWNGSCEHMVQTHSKTPNVTLFPIALLKHLGRHVVRSPCQFGQILFLLLDNGKPKINKLNLSMAAKHDVVWLDVPVYNSL